MILGFEYVANIIILHYRILHDRMEYLLISKQSQIFFKTIHSIFPERKSQLRMIIPPTAKASGFSGHKLYKFDREIRQMADCAKSAEK